MVNAFVDTQRPRNRKSTRCRSRVGEEGEEETAGDDSIKILAFCSVEKKGELKVTFLTYNRCRTDLAVESVDLIELLNCVIIL